MKRRLLALFIICTMVVGLSACGGETSGGTGTDKKSSNSESTESAIVYEINLYAGNYTAGKDIPTGTYDLTVTSGIGKVLSSDMPSGTLNERMRSPATDLYKDNYTGLQLTEGTMLSVSGTAIVHAVSEDANTAGVTGRTVADPNPIILGEGTYVAGIDFPAATFTVVAVEGGGSGFVSSDNVSTGGLNEMIGVSVIEGFGITQFYNASFPTGTTLSIRSTTIQLVPAGE